MSLSAASPALRDLLAKRFLGLHTTEDYVNWALRELLAGRDETSLCILAGLGPLPYQPEVEHYFARALKEIGIPLPETQSFLSQYVRELASQILAGSMTCREGCRKLHEIWRALKYPAELENWVLLDEGLEPNSYRTLDGEELDAAIRVAARTLLESG